MASVRGTWQRRRAGRCRLRARCRHSAISASARRIGAARCRNRRRARCRHRAGRRAATASARSRRPRPARGRVGNCSLGSVIRGSSTLIRRQLEVRGTIDKRIGKEWVKTLASVQGVKGRIGVITRTAEWLSNSHVLDESDMQQVCAWINTFASKTGVKSYESLYPTPRSTIPLPMAQPELSETTQRPAILLRAYDLSECEARCCYDGVYLGAGEEGMIRMLLPPILISLATCPAILSWTVPGLDA